MKTESTAAPYPWRAEALLVYSRMQSIIERNPQWLRHYQRDFHVHDRDSINMEFRAGHRYQWVVSDSGTHLNRIGVHPGENEWAMAAIDNYGTRKNPVTGIFLITEHAIKPLSIEQAKAELSRMEYWIENNMVGYISSHEQWAVKVTHKPRQGDANRYVSIEFTGPETAKSRLQDLVTIGRRIATTETQSLFVKIESIDLNGQDIVTMIHGPGQATTSQAVLKPIPT